MIYEYYMNILKLIFSILLLALVSCQGGISFPGKANARNKLDNVATTVPAGDLLTVKIPQNLASQQKQYTGFFVDFNCENGTPNYVSWELLSTETDGPVSRSNNFWQDTDIKGCPTTDDYKHSGYDRGHLCPSADQKWSKSAMEDCFVMTNICPQTSSLNSGAWNTLEKKERLWAQRDSAIIIIAGPIYETEDTKRIGHTGVRVPSAFFKVLYAPYATPARAIAFVYPNMKAPGNMANYSMSIDRLEEITRYDFFYTLPPDVQNQIESTASFRLWDKR